MTFLTRFMLDLRGLYFVDQPDDTIQGDGASYSITVLSNIRFTTSFIIGNLGATLTHSDLPSKFRSVASPTHGAGDVEDPRTGVGEALGPCRIALVPRTELEL